MPYKNKVIQEDKNEATFQKHLDEINEQNGHIVSVIHEPCGYVSNIRIIYEV